MVNANPVLVNKPGPLPISFEYTPRGNVEETIVLSGSMYSEDIASENIGFALRIDGKTVAKSTIYTNDTRGTHHATIPTTVNYDIPVVMEGSKVKPVKMELVPINFDSHSNKNDFFNLTIFN